MKNKVLHMKQAQNINKYSIRITNLYIILNFQIISVSNLNK